MQSKTTEPNYITHKLHSVCSAVLHLCNTAHLASSKKMLQYSTNLKRMTGKIQNQNLSIHFAEVGRTSNQHVGPTWSQHVGLRLIRYAVTLGPCGLPTWDRHDNLGSTLAQRIHAIWVCTLKVGPHRRRA